MEIKVYEAEFEYFCFNCKQLRLSCNKTLTLCGNCNSSNIVKGEIGSLNKEELLKGIKQMNIEKVSDAIETLRAATCELQNEIEDNTTSSCEDCAFFRSCLACVYGDEQNEICKFYGSRPPWKFVVKGCDKFEDKNEMELSLDGVMYKDGITPDNIVSGIPIPEDDIPF